MTTLTEFKEIEAKATKPLSIHAIPKYDMKDGVIIFSEDPTPHRYSIRSVSFDEQGQRITHFVGDIWREYDANTFVISRSALPALIAVAEGMESALSETRALVAEGAMEGFVPDKDDWGMRLFANQQKVSKALAAFEVWKDNIEGEK